MKRVRKTRRRGSRLASVSCSLTMAVAALCTGSARVQSQSAPPDVRPDHWAYRAVSDLASAGLIKGYPPDGRFLGGRSITRYEMAALLQRIVARIDELARRQSTPLPAAPDADTLRPRVEELRRLLTEFRAELMVIGTDVARARDAITELSVSTTAQARRIDRLSENLDRTAGRVDEARLRADQSIASLADLREAMNSALKQKVDVAAGRLQIGGLISVWFGTAFGQTPGGSFPGSFDAAPQGRNYGGGAGDTFRLRHAEISLDGRIDRTVDYHAMFDPTQTGSGPNSVLQDLWVGVRLHRYMRLEVGQQKTGLSEEGTRDDSRLLTVARSIMNEDLPTNAGRVGNIRDTGAVLRFAASRFHGHVGIFNDNGANAGGVDTNRLKFLTGSFYVSTLRHFTFGIWGGANIGDYRPRERRDRAGATFLYQGGPHTLEVEGAYARDINAAANPARAGSIGLGFYALYAYRISRKWQIVARYDVWDPAQHDTGDSVTASGVLIPQADHKLKEYTVGFNYLFGGPGTRIQVNYIREDVERNGAAFFGQPRTLLLSNFQVAF